MKASSKTLIDRNLIAQLAGMFWPPIFVFSLHVILSHGLHLYSLLLWIDIPMHFLGGLSMAYSLFLVLAFLQDSGVISRLDRIIEWALVFTLVATIAVFWEFLEFSIDHLFRSNVQISLPNTMQDLFMGILGASNMIGYKILKKLQ
jgi:hypothetical protein